MSQTTYRKFIAVFVALLLPILACGGSPTHLEQARAAVEEGDTATALEEYTQAIEEENAQPADVFTALTERADLYVQEDDQEAALADYEAALAVTDEEGQPVGDHAAVYDRRADIYIAQENWEAAVTDLDAILAGQPENYEALAQRGYAHLQLRNFEQAIADLKASLQGDVAAASADLDSKRNLVRAYYDLAQAMQNLGEYEDAVEYHTEALDLAEDSDDQAEILAARGFVYSELEENDKALADLDQAIALDSGMALAYAYRSYVYSDQEQYEAAIADATKAVDLGEDLSEARRSSILHARALAYLYVDDYEQAIADATGSIELLGPDDPDTARTYNIRSQAHRLAGNYEQAIADATQAIELGITDVTGLGGFYRTRALAYYYADDYEAALADLDAVTSIETETPDPDNFDLKGLIQYEAGDYEGAIESYQQALELAPDDPWLHNNLGDVYYEQEDWGSAETAYQAAIRLDDSEPLFPENLGAVLRRTDRYEEAIASYTAALALDDQRPFAYLGRGISHYQLAQDQQAAADLQTVLDFDVPPDVVDLVQEFLAELNP